MFVGHFGIAQLGKGARRDLSLIWLAVAAYLPDLVRFGLGFVAEPQQEIYSHSIPAVAVMALVIGALWIARGGTVAAAAVLALACLLHWPADVFTGCKPTTANGPWIGFVNYRRPLNDLLLEGALLVGGWWFARRAGMAMRKRWIALIFALQLAFLLSMYYGSEFFLGDREWMWKPNQSLVPRRAVLETTSCRPPESR
jgi:uncharacterized membrane protein YozB (DUF420 family)